MEQPKIPPRSTERRPVPRTIPKTSTTSNLKNNFGTPRPKTLNFNKTDNELLEEHHIPEVNPKEDNIQSFHDISDVRTPTIFSNPRLGRDYLRSDVLKNSSRNRYDGNEYWERESSNSSGSHDPCLDTECFDTLWYTLIDWIKRVLVGKRSFFLIPIVAGIFLYSLHRENNLSNRLFERIFSNKLAFTEGSILSEQMSNPNALDVNLYFFNITNFEEVEAFGHKPNVTEIGPYVYTFSSQNVETSFEPEKHSVKFRRKINIKFNRSQTENKLNPHEDYIYHADPLSIMYANLKEKYLKDQMFMNLAVSSMIGESEMYPINHNTVGGLLHGYEDSRISMLKGLVKTLISNTGDTAEYKEQLIKDYHDIIPDHLGILQFLNNTIGEQMEVNDGTENIRNLLQIKSIGSKITNPCWGFNPTELDRLNQLYNDTCDDEYKQMLHLQNQQMQLIANSSDGIFYPPLTDLDDPPNSIKVYDEAQQRSINVSLVRDSETGKPKVDKKTGFTSFRISTRCYNNQ